MFKFADLQLDAGSDPGFRKLASIYKKSSFLSKVGDLDVLDPEDLKLLGDEDFALIYIDKEGNKTRRFPCPDVQNTLVSVAYFLDNKDSLPETAKLIAAHILRRKLNNIRDVVLSTDIHDKVDHKVVDELSDKLWDEIPCGWAAGGGNCNTNIYREPSPQKIEGDDCVKAINAKVAAEKAYRANMSDDDFVFVTKKAGRTVRLFPIANKEDLKKQAAYFNENHVQFAPEHRNLFARKLRDKAKDMQVKLDTRTISKYASSEWCPTAYECLKHRIDMLSTVDVVSGDNVKEAEWDLVCSDTRAEVLKGYIKLAHQIGQMDIDKYAETLRFLDKAAGFDKGYGRTIRDAYQSTYKQAAFNTNDLISQANDTFTNFMGTTVTAKDLLGLDLAQLGGMIDQATFDEMMKDPIAVFNSLPIPYKSVIISALGK